MDSSRTKFAEDSILDNCVYNIIRLLLFRRAQHSAEEQP